MYLTAHLELDQFTYVIFVVISFVLLLSNVIVYFVHEKVVSTLVENSEYQLEKIWSGNVLRVMRELG